jgi:uncharacterized protein YbjT (DUF2867 family)
MTTRSVVIGAHGRTGSLVVSELLRAGHRVTGTVRTAQQQQALRDRGAACAVVDLMTVSTDELADILSGSDAVVYTAGSGYGSTREHVEQLDRDAIIRAADAAVIAGADRFVLVSAHRTDDDFGDETVLTLLRAKRAADAHVRSTTLDWTILRPDALTDAPPTGRIRAASTVPHGSIPRTDLAATIRLVLETPHAARKQFEITSGDEPLADALRNL